MEPLMALNKIYDSSQRLHRARLLTGISNPTTPPTTIQPGTPVTFGAGNLPAVSLTASGNGTKTQTTGLSAGVTSVTFSNGGIGLASGEASFAFDGTFEFAVTGATTSTANDVEVFIIPASGLLTLTSSTNVHYGWTDYPDGFTKENGRAAVRVGK
jgi:hypothetical protein